MRYLLDSHVFLWWLQNDLRLVPSVLDLIKDPANQIWVSAASIWEIGIKQANGKLRVPEGLSEQISLEGFKPLNISVEHAQLAARLPKHHSDPFDRMLVAQAMLERLKLVTADRHLKSYDVPLIYF